MLLLIRSAVVAHLHRGPSLDAYPVVLRRSFYCVGAELVSLAMTPEVRLLYRVNTLSLALLPSGPSHLIDIPTSPVTLRKDLWWKITCLTLTLAQL